MSAVVVYQGDGEWSAIYLDGKLQRVGDHYLADEWIREHFGVETVQSNDFFLGRGDQRRDVADTVEQIQAYTAERSARLAKAYALREQAEALEAEAEQLEKS